MRIAISGGKVYDPANGVDGDVRTVYIDGETIIAPPPGGVAADKTIDARGRVVFPGGVDMHCHIAGPTVNRARRLAAALDTEDRGAGGRPCRFPLVPPAPATGLRYSLLGYTTAVDAAIAPSASRQCHLELQDTPSLDCAFLLLLADHELVLDLLERGERELASEAVAALLHRTSAYGIKAVNPGGRSHWKERGEGITGFAAPISGRRLSPRAIVEFLADTAASLGLPHPVHIHANKLGVPGNVEVTLETSRALAGRRHHLTHVQFHAYGRDAQGGHTSAAQRLVEHIDSHSEVSCDVGQVMFGEALTLSADQELEDLLWRLTGRPYVDLDVELETGCGMVPLEYRPRSRLHTLQWTVGLEVFLLAQDPWRVALTTDHPNGGSFVTYPKIIAQLMDAGARRAAMAAARQEVVERSVLRHIEREYTLGEIAIVTRAGPARILGLAHKGHLGPGADADVTVYDDCSDREAMFRRPLWVLQRGRIVVENGEPRGAVDGATACVRPDAAPEAATALRQWHARHGSVSFEQVGPAPWEAAERCRPVRTVRQ